MSVLENLFVPDGAPVETAVGRVTHMGIGAHQDDLEIFAYHGIETCFLDPDKWFAGVTVTDGGGSARVGPYESFTDDQMKQVRHDEQNSAAVMGEYSFQSQLGHASSAVKDVNQSARLVEELFELLDRCRPKTLYLHNPTDKHSTHIATLARCLDALRRLPVEARPQKVYGCEGWRDLDWLDDRYKIALPVDKRPELASRLIEVFDSQVAGGKDYVQATLGRRRANATFFHSHQVDESTALTFAMDLGPLLAKDPLTVSEFVSGHLDRLKEDVLERARAFNLI